jgi:DNA-directed RNA polymerase
MYGPSHLQQFIDEAHSLDPSKKTRIRIAYAKRRAQWILKSDEEWTKPDKLKLGILLIEVLLENATIRQMGRREKAFSYEKRYFSKDKCIGKIYLHDALYKTVTEHTFDSLEGNTTRFKPMVMPPRDWVAPDDGGYSWLKTDLMRTHGSKMQKVCTP